jgi:hypothetical protein
VARSTRARIWLLRRVLRALHVPDDAVRHLTTLRHLGEPLEPAVPRELMPVASRTLFQALRSRAAAQITPGWVGPFWLERQLDPASPAFVPRGALPFLTNVTYRNWTAIGTLDGRREAIVDPRGLVTPPGGGWSLDWWIGADDRWHLPSREVAVRQRLLGASPVVETAMSIPAGDAVARAYAARRSSAEGGGEVVVVEVENRSRAPVALALAVRPYTPEGLTVIERIDLAGSPSGSTVSVDGRPAVVLPRAPARVAGSTLRGGDSAAMVMGGDAAERWRGPVRDPAGLAQAAFVFPLAHGATFRAVIPLDAEPGPAATTYPSVLPPAEAVAAGWRAQGDRGMRLELPDERLAEAVAANRRFLLLALDGDEITPGPATYHRFWFRDAAYMLGALDRYGYHDEVSRVVASYPARQRADGFFWSQRDEWDANGAALVTLAEHWRLGRDAALASAVAEPVARAAQWIEHARRSRRGDPDVAGLLPPGRAAEHLGPFDRYFWDDFWSVAGLRAAGELLGAAGQPEAAADARRFADGMWADVEKALARTADRLAIEAIPAGPHRRIDSGAVGSLAACAPLGLLAADDPRMVATVEALRDRFTAAEGRALFHGITHTGLSTYLTLQLAAVELRAGDRRCLDRLAWLLEVASPTWTWPEAVHPYLGGGCMGDGHHGWAAAELLTFVRDLLVREEGDGLALASLVPGSWYGQGWEVHDAPTAHGRASYAVRWHGDRVALLWEVEPHEGHGPVRLTARGLEPGWSTTDRRGEALLGPVPAVGTPARTAAPVGAARPVRDDGASFG